MFKRLIATACLFLSPLAAYAMAPTGERDFYDALGDTLGDFEHDLQSDTVKGAKNFAIRDIITNERIPRSFTPHLEAHIEERVIRATKVKIIQCTGCKARRMTLGKGQTAMQLTSARTNQAELAQVAKTRGIDHFLDVVFTFQPSGLLISMTTTQAKDGTILWSKTYNSETSRAALFRRGINNETSQAGVRKATEYPATLQYRLRVDYLFEPNIEGTTGCMGLAFRMVERYDNRKKEVGFEAEYLKDMSTLTNGAATTSANSLYSLIDMTLIVLHAWNFIGGEEDLNRARGSLYVGVGGTYALGFLGGLFRTGFEWRMAKHIAAGITLGYRPPSTAFLQLGSTSSTSVSGFEYGGGISFLF